MLLPWADLRILYDQVSWGQYQGDEGRRKEHLNDCNVSVVAAEDARKRVGVVDSEAL